MANTSSKRVATSNESALRNLLIGLVGSNALYVVLRTLLRPRPLISGASFMYLFTVIPSLFLYRFLVFTGSPKRNHLGHINKSGEDLSSKGPIEWATDTLYVIWIVTVLAPLLGYRAYWLLFVIPGWVGYIAYQFAAPLYAQQMAKQQQQQQQRVPAQQQPQQEVAKEELSKTQAKKEARRKQQEKAQRGGRR